VVRSRFPLRSQAPAFVPARPHPAAGWFPGERTETAASGRRRESELAKQAGTATATPTPAPAKEFDVDDGGDSAALQVRAFSGQMRGVARNAAHDRDDGMGM
jgi:hypothetical protein